MMSRFLLTAIVLFLVSACQTRPPSVDQNSDFVWRTDPAYFSDEINKLSAQASWRYSAKVGLSTPTLKEQANLDWEFEDKTNNIRLSGPLGIGTVRLLFNKDGGATLIDNKGVKHQGRDAEELLLSIVGWQIPINALNDWVQLVPASGSSFRYALDQDQQLAKLEQLGWQIEYSQYRLYGDRLMPRRIVARKFWHRETMGYKPSGSSENQVVVKLITKGWN